MDDGAEGLWRVRNGIYDLKNFVKKHPGGQDWLVLTKGTDITEAFESHHLNPFVEELLQKYYIRPTKQPRNSPFTFEEEGFYKTLKAAAREKLKDVPKSAVNDSARITDGLLMTLLVSSVVACWANKFWLKIVPLILSSMCLSWLSVCGHNYTHHKDNWRMYLYNLSMTSYRDFRISHALSHHQFPNTLMDWKISAFEPLFPWLPRRNKGTRSNFAFLMATIPFLFFLTFIKKVTLCFSRKGFYKNHWRWHDFIGFLLPAWMLAISGTPAGEVLKTWVYIVLGGSFFFFSIALNAAHHHPSIFHDGDEQSSSIDWGLHQVEAVMDRTDINGNLFKVMTFFGDHALHHLFPTVDHASLAYLYPVFLEHCTKYQANFRTTSQLDLVLGQIKQLMKADPTLKSG